MFTHFTLHQHFAAIRPFLASAIYMREEVINFDRPKLRVSENQQ